MNWNPETYNQFKSDRYKPFYDLLELVQVKPGLKVIDLGCGTGELTSKLADALPESDVTGIDSSAEMLKESQAFVIEGLRFLLTDIESQLEKDETFDLIFSNAAIQWIDDHEKLLARIISKLRPGGQLLVQIPNQNQNISNRLIQDIARREPFQGAFKGWFRKSPVLDIEQYAKILYENGCMSMSVFEKIYPLTLPDVDALLEWVSGTALLPYLDRLQEPVRAEFREAYQKELQLHFDKLPVFYPFRRIVIEGQF